MLSMPPLVIVGETKLVGTYNPKSREFWIHARSDKNDEIPVLVIKNATVETARQLATLLDLNGAIKDDAYSVVCSKPTVST